MLNWKIVTVSLGSFSAINFVACVAYGLIAPAGLHAAWLLESVLPGFKWLTPGAFVLGVIETFIYGAYAGALYSVVYNYVARRFAVADEPAARRSRAA